MTSVPKSEMFDCDIKPMSLRYPLSDYHMAMSEGPLHPEWEDKPHRLVYDLIAAVRFYEEQSHPPPTPQREPLSDEQIAHIATNECGWNVTPERFPKVVRAIERAHGIGAEGGA